MIEAIDLCKQFERNVRKNEAAEETAKIERETAWENRLSVSDEEELERSGKESKKRKKDRSNTKTKKMVKEEFLAVDHVSLRAQAGEIVGILGPNGAGKTTLLRMLGMLMTPTSGTVRLWEETSACNPTVEVHAPSDQREMCDSEDNCGENTFGQTSGHLVTDPVQRKEAIGYLSGNTKLYPRFSIREYLCFMGELYGLSRDEIEARSQQIIDLLDMGAFADNRMERLSTGQTQRASIARCLMADPLVYILDEPTLGLDILSADAIIRFMQSQKKRGKTVLYSTHYLEEAQTLCDRIYMINQGRIVAEGTPQGLIEQTGTESLREAFHVFMDSKPVEF